MNSDTERKRAKYQDWVDENYPTKESADNKCNQAVTFMKRKFPELTVCTGKADGVFHCWLIDESGGIIDPTAHQFDKRIKEYRLFANRFLNRNEVDVASGVVTLDTGEVFI